MTPRARPMSPDDRRRAILDAVVPLVIEHGGDLSTRLIAEAAGVAEGTIFRVFADKTELMWAVAEEAINPEHGREEFEAMLASDDDLHERVRRAAETLTLQLHRMMRVMFAVRSYMMKQGHDHRHEGPPGPPEFMVRANRQLLEMLSGLFEPYADQLRVPPATAAVVLRSLVFGSAGMDLGADLTSDQVADIIVGGVMLPEEDA
ncbi:TetR/AcrR family transcriptional regulator [Nocardioides sp. JQ2195]|uniref:TetR/AcrR family transcriptional regulator n=1 Tax=Nocardioides sp. JQ2195 TaxID=2592334 RepID=UPI00143ED7BD|nr:TetR/AcrR family transcriptional regulator [Nocardioides sp. JQ2195]QIX28031.1 TetR/AcrR family transcriptional regulator [Nocardioides sp. JQ2195]